MVESGAVLCGKYRVEQVLGRGGMGVVTRARHLDLDQPVALKLLRPEVLQNQNAVERFRREARAMVQLKSEHVCRVFDVGMVDGGAHYMVMEYLEGRDLGALLREHGRLAPGFAVDLVLQACEALAEAHALGIVHRDIKPANCFLTDGPDGEPLLKVLDFGIAKALGDGDDGITTSQAVIGSPSYMSPEQMRSSKHVDTRTDIWALGVVLYELVSGRRPFQGDSFAGLCLAVTTTPMAPLDDGALPEGLAAVIARCLEKQPDERFGSIAELSAALAPYARTSAQGERSSARTARMLERASSPALTASSAGMTAARQTRGSDGLALEPTVTASASGSTTGRTTRPLPGQPGRRRPRRSWLLAAGGLVLLLALGVARGAANWQPGAPEPHTPEPHAPEPVLQASTASEPGARAAAAGAPEPVAAAGRPPRATDVQGQEPGRAQGEGTASRAEAGTAPRTRRGGARARGQRNEPDARPGATREPAAPAEAQRAAPPSAPGAVESWLDDEEFGARQ
jgi:serine/threonine-protein kinase